MAYKLYTDRNESFECEISVKNASLKGSIARLIVESNGLTLAFNGKIEGEKCIIPIKRLRGLLEENSMGKMHLEVVVEDTYFKPWEDQFIVEEHTSVKVRVNEQKESTGKPIVEVKKPTMKNQPPVVKEQKKSHPPTNKKTSPTIVKKNINVQTPLNEISTICHLFGIDNKNIVDRKQDFKHILKEYFSSNTQYNNYKKTILSKITDFLN
jgi:hypothetical protein